MNRLRLFTIPSLAFCGLCIAACCFGGGDGDLASIHIRQLTIGFSGKYKIGSWAPVYITLEAPAGEPLVLELTVPDGDGVPTTTTVDHVVSRHAATSVVEMLCKIGRPDGQIELVVQAKDQPVAVSRYRLEAADYRPLSSATKLVVTLGTAENLRAACTQQGKNEGSQTVVAEMGQADRLPSSALGYDGVDTVFISGSRPPLKKLLHSEQTVSALQKWVRWGGQIVMSIGGNEAELLQAKGLLQAFSPGHFVELVSLRQLRPLEMLGGGSDPLIKEDERGQSEPFFIPFIEVKRGRAISTVNHGGQQIPLLIRSTLGFGQSTLLAVDIEQPEFTSWNGTRNLIHKLLSGTANKAPATPLSSSGELAHAGYDDLAGQLRAALDQFEEQGVWFIPFELLFLCGIVYLLLVAPGDYLFLRWLTKRMEFTWLSFPLLVVVCSVGVYLVARATKGDRQLINQAEVVDIDLSSGQVRGLCWFTLFSPQTQRYDLSAACRLPVGQAKLTTNVADAPKAEARKATLFSWMGLPGTGLGGMESPIVTPLFERGYRYGPRLAQLQHVPLSIWSTKCFSIRYTGSVSPLIDSTLTEKSSGEDALIEGSIVSRLEQPLRDAVLLHNGWAYPLGTLNPNEVQTIDRNQTVRTVRNYLSRLGPLDRESEKQRYEVQRIFQRMLLYRAASRGGSIALKNDYLHGLDMSHLLENQAAILMGLVDHSSFQIHNGQQMLTQPESLRAAVYRFILPVQPVASRQETTGRPPADATSHALFAREEQR